MPQLNEIRLAKELSYKGTGKVIWIACEKCGKERWIFLVKNKPAHRRCPSCARHSNKGISYKYIPHEVKECSKCQRILPATSNYFYATSQVKDGLVSKCKQCFADYSHNHKPSKETKARRNQYKQYHHANNPKLKLSENISNAIGRSLRGNKNGRHWETLVGFTLEQLRKRLEYQFTDGMDWGNYGKWHVDHRIPIMAFNFKEAQDIDFKRCWDLANLQPLWQKENDQKGAKINGGFQPSLIS